MSARIVPINYEGQAVRFNAEGWLHATEIAERFDKRPNDWLSLPSTIEYLEALNRRTVTGLSGNAWSMTKRGGKNQGTWLHPKLAVAFARWLSVDFAVWCDEQVDALLRGESKPWASARREAAIGHKAVCDAIALNCEAQGKTAKPHHFINEARLINQVITGYFAGRDRNQLNAAELELVTLAELRDTALIGTGMVYAERKVNLLRYVRELQSKHQRRIAA
ncbi:MULTISPECIES: KilA-N domain-containing protein [unclassified Pseudomonas]|uniref:KilA-N domain-containing protein n=1 Tax=unclassified Pseudomonas TaxID=196821 RepID=UPI002B2288EA|nr:MULTISPECIES: KilA-N domain-containing protein [unclassified Pseudomonas]MEA9979314.1 KilA-N domain-containing protein [Pseudomonas sp. RTS4]MEB0197903.1 KilA-N domain-containing protein [Pseudomonas sp. 5S4]MEB0246411.1 KilA-N domain-containing protein [Pseudomonas sp. 10S5]